MAAQLVEQREICKEREQISQCDVKRPELLQYLLEAISDALSLPQETPNSDLESCYFVQLGNPLLPSLVLSS